MLTFIFVGRIQVLFGDSGGTFSPAVIALDALCVVSFIVVAATRTASLRRLLTNSAPLLLFLGFEVVTLPWAADVGGSSISFLGVGLRLGFIVAMVAALGADRLAKSVGLSLDLLMAGSIVFAVAKPSLGLAASHFSVVESSTQAAWQGVFIGKNMLGHVAGLAFAWAVVDFKRRSAARNIVSLLLAAVCVFFSRSSTGLTIAVAAPLLVWLGGVLGQRGAWVTKGLVLTGILAGLLLLPLISSFWLDVVGKDTTLTGRTQIWAWAWPYALERPLTGMGFSYTSLNEFAGRLDAAFHVVSVHNALLDLLITAGWPATIFLIAAIAIAAFRLWGPSTHLANQAGRSLAACLLAVCAVSSTTEAMVNLPTGPMNFYFLTGLFLLFGLIPKQATAMQSTPVDRFRRLIQTPFRDLRPGPSVTADR